MIILYLFKLRVLLLMPKENNIILVNIVFFEVQKWEKDFLSKEFPEAQITDEKLTAQNATSFSQAEIISPFIYSKLDRQTLEQFPNLKFIATRSTGFDHIDEDYCKEKGITVSNVPEYGSNTVAEHTFALILSLTRKIYQAINQTRNLNFNHEELTGIDLYGKTLGIIGLGKIGENVLRIGIGFGMKVQVATRHPDEILLSKYSFGYTDLETLISSSDIITLHVPLTPETKHIINSENVMKFKKGSYLINTARGGLVETGAILLGIDQGILDGVGLDVLEEEDEMNEEISVLAKKESDENLKTLVLNHVLINHPKVLITPHNAFNSREALERIDKTTVENIDAFVKGSPLNLAY
jgi:D-lactate dehydrogenase